MEEYVSLNACGHCGKEDLHHIKKVICHGYAGMLCYSCRLEFEDAIRATARRYLGTRKENVL